MTMIECRIFDAQSSFNFALKNKMKDKTQKTTLKCLHHRKTNVFLAFFSLLLLTHISKSNANFNLNNENKIGSNEMRDSIESVDGNDITNTTSSTFMNPELVELKKTMKNVMEAYNDELGHCERTDVTYVGVVDDGFCDQSVREVKNKASYVVEKTDALNESESIDSMGIDWLGIFNLDPHVSSEIQRKWKEMTESLKKEFEAKCIESCNSRLREAEKDMSYEALRQKTNEFTIELCARQIQNGKLDIAHKTLNEIFDIHYDEIAKLTYLAYNGSANNMDEILEFLRTKVPRWLRPSADRALLEAIKKNGDLSDPKLLLFRYDNQNSFRDIYDELDPHVDSILSNLVDMVNGGSYPSLKDIYNKYKHPVFDWYFSGLMKRIYDSKLENVIKVISWILHLDTEEQKASANLQLFEEMKRNGHYDSVELVYLACSVYSNSYYLGSDNSEIATIIKELPESVRQLLFEADKQIVIESREHVGYRLSGDGEYNVYTYKHEGYNEREVWYRGLYMLGPKCFFSFQNSGKHLCSSTVGWPHNLGMPSPMEDINLEWWEVHPVENGAYVYLKNLANGKILDSNSHVVKYNNKCCRSEAHTYERYTGTNLQHWKIL